MHPLLFVLPYSYLQRGMTVFSFELPERVALPSQLLQAHPQPQYAPADMGTFAILPLPRPPVQPEKL